jgi:hypothetical protein
MGFFARNDVPGMILLRLSPTLDVPHPLSETMCWMLFGW